MSDSRRAVCLNHTETSGGQQIRRCVEQLTQTACAELGPGWKVITDCGPTMRLELERPGLPTIYSKTTYMSDVHPGVRYVGDFVWGLWQLFPQAVAAARVALQAESIRTMTTEQGLATLAVRAHSFALSTNPHKSRAETPSEYVRNAYPDGSDVVGEINDTAPLFELFVYPDNAVGSYSFVGSALLPLLQAAVLLVVKP